MTHLTPTDWVDLMDGTLADERRAHFDECAVCRHEAESLQGVVGEARAADVPEPSPLFWEQLSARVRTAIADEPMVLRRLRWFDWPVLSPVAGLALVIMALAFAVASVGDQVAGEQVAVLGNSGERPGDGSGGTVDGEDSQWTLVEQLVGDLDVEGARAAGIATMPGSADRVVMQLTSGEQQELIRLLTEELKAGS
jgi:hypothetical protein